MQRDTLGAAISSMSSGVTEAVNGVAALSQTVSQSALVATEAAEGARRSAPPLRTAPPTQSERTRQAPGAGSPAIHTTEKALHEGEEDRTKICSDPRRATRILPGSRTEPRGRVAPAPSPRSELHRRGSYDHTTPVKLTRALYQRGPSPPRKRLATEDEDAGPCRASPRSPMLTPARELVAALEADDLFSGIFHEDRDHAARDSLSRHAALRAVKRARTSNSDDPFASSDED